MIFLFFSPPIWKFQFKFSGFNNFIYLYFKFYFTNNISHWETTENGKKFDSKTTASKNILDFNLILWWNVKRTIPESLLIFFLFCFSSGRHFGGGQGGLNLFLPPFKKMHLDIFIHKYTDILTNEYFGSTPCTPLDLYSHPLVLETGLFLSDGPKTSASLLRPAFLFFK